MNNENSLIRDESFLTAKGVKIQKPHHMHSYLFPYLSTSELYYTVYTACLFISLERAEPAEDNYLLGAGKLMGDFTLARLSSVNPELSLSRAFSVNKDQL